jgi:hypothetical protein
MVDDKHESQANNMSGKANWWEVEFSQVRHALPWAIAGGVLLGVSKIVSIVWPHQQELIRFLELIGTGPIIPTTIMTILAIASRYRLPLPNWYRDLRRVTGAEPALLLTVACLFTFITPSGRRGGSLLDFLEIAPFLVLTVFTLTRAASRKRAYSLLSQRNAMLVILWWAIVFSFTVAVYAWITAMCVNHFHWFKLSGTNGPYRTTTIEEFYLWHLAQAIPVVNLTDTFHWRPPLTYTSFFVGLLMVVFMVTVAAPMIAFAAEWRRFRRDHPKSSAGPSGHQDRAGSRHPVVENSGQTIKPKPSTTEAPAEPPDPT